MPTIWEDPPEKFSFVKKATKSARQRLIEDVMANPGRWARFGVTDSHSRAGGLVAGLGKKGFVVATRLLGDGPNKGKVGVWIKYDPAEAEVKRTAFQARKAARANGEATPTTPTTATPAQPYAFQS